MIAAASNFGGYIFEEGRLTYRQLSAGSIGSAATSWTRAYLFGDPLNGPGRRVRLSGALNAFTEIDSAGHTTPTWSLDLEEAYWAETWRALTLKVGQQVIAWGALDSLSPTDLFDVIDRRFQIGRAQEDGTARLGIPAVRALISLAESHLLDLVVAPFASVDRGFISGTNVALFRPGLADDLLTGFRAQVMQTVPADQQMAYEALVAGAVGRTLGLAPEWQAQTSLGGIWGGPTAPGFAPEAGLRLSGATSALEYGATVMTVHERVPLVQIDDRILAAFLAPGSLSAADLQAATLAAAQSVTTSLPRFQAVGTDLGFHWDRMMYKVEAAYRSGASHYDLNLHSFSPPQVSAGAHAEYVNGERFGVVVEGLWTRALTDQPLLFIFRQQVRLSGRAYAALGDRERLRLQIEGAYEFLYEDFYAGPDVSFDLTEHAALSAGVKYFGGKPTFLTYAALADPASRATLRVGAFSYYRDESFTYAKLRVGF
jgi:hypothetical protein